MTNEEIALKLQETTDRSLRNEGRIKDLEGEHRVLHQLATSVAVMAQQMESLNSSVDALSGKVDVLEEKPGKHWDSIVDKLIAAGIGAVIAWLAVGAPGA